MDVGFKFAEARHERGFTAATASVIWRLMPQGRGEIKAVDDEATSSRPGTAQPRLPGHLAHLLNDLNLKQSRYEQAARSLETERQYLFADWHKYLSSRYPGYGDSPYPDAGQIQFYLRREVIPRLEKQQRDLGMEPAGVNALLQQMVQGSRLASLSSSQLPTEDTPARDLLQAVEDMAVAVAECNARLSTKGKVKIEFSHIPAYSPDFNLAEYIIHQIRLQVLHHMPIDATLDSIEVELETYLDKHQLQTPEQIKNTLEHIFNLTSQS